MHFDLPTLVAMGSFVAASAGTVLLIAWSQNRKIRALAIWGLANIVDALGILCLGLGPALGQPIFAVVASSLLVLAPGPMWKAARTFEKKPAPLALALIGPLVVVVASAIPGTRGVAGFLSLAAASFYLIAAAAALWLGRREKLPARWPIVILTGRQKCAIAHACREPCASPARDRPKRVPHPASAGVIGRATARPTGNSLRMLHDFTVCMEGVQRRGAAQRVMDVGLHFLRRELWMEAGVRGSVGPPRGWFSRQRGGGTRPVAAWHAGGESVISWEDCTASTVRA